MYPLGRLGFANRIQDELQAQDIILIDQPGGVVITIQSDVSGATPRRRQAQGNAHQDEQISYLLANSK